MIGDIRVYESDGATLICETNWPSFCDANSIDDDEASGLWQELRTIGRVWVGGGAAPLFLIMMTLPR